VTSRPSADPPGDGLVIIVSYGHAGADRVQHGLAAAVGLACTSGTGVIPQCAAAVEAWQRIEDRDGLAISPLAAATVRSLVTAQMTAILARTGQTRWCELTTAAPATVELFAQVIPQARFVCVHRSCPDVIRAALQASPWGLHGPGLVPYLHAYPGNNVAALAAYWANSTQELLAFEATHLATACRIRYEDAAARPDEEFATARAFLQLEHAPPPGPSGPDHVPVQDSDRSTGRLADVPAEMIPEPLRERISRLHAELGYLHSTPTARR
jgi:hypothetical protein